MKKSVMKSLAAFLVLALMVASLPVAVFAEEPEHCHDEMCCPDSEAEVTAAAICNHVYSMATPSARWVITETAHRYEEITLYTCSKCGHSYEKVTSAGDTVAHSYTKTLIDYDLSTGAKIYKYTCVCGKNYMQNEF